MSEVTVIKCDKCGKLHDPASSDFVRVEGSIVISASKSADPVVTGGDYCKACLDKLLGIPGAVIRSGRLRA